MNDHIFWWQSFDLPLAFWWLAIGVGFLAALIVPAAILEAGWLSRAWVRRLLLLQHVRERQAAEQILQPWQLEVERRRRLLSDDPIERTTPRT